MSVSPLNYSAAPDTASATRRLSALLRSVGLRHGLVLGGAMVAAGGLDYLVNVVAGRWLRPVEYGVFISVTALVQVLILLSITMRIVVAFYASQLSARNETAALAAFLQRTWRWSWRWGMAATALMAVTAPLVARLLRLPDSWPLWAASLMALALFLRETTYGSLQGIQAFGGLGLVQVTQALLRMALAAILIWAGYRASGAILAQPLSSAIGLLPALWWLRPHFGAPGAPPDADSDAERSEAGGEAEGSGVLGRKRAAAAVERTVSWRYSAHTLVGLAVFGMIANLDALFVKHYFSAQAAGNYGPVVTLSKVSLFLPWAIGIVMFPKVTQKHARGEDARPILVASLLAAFAPGLMLTAAYFLFPGLLVKFVFTGAYANPGLVLGMASLAATLFAGLNIWLNYALSLKRTAFVSALVAVLVWQAAAMVVFGRENLVHMTFAMVSAGVVGNIAGFLTTWFATPAAAPIPATAAGEQEAA